MGTITQEEERVKIFGLCLIIAGAIWGIIAFNMKTTVETESKTFGEGMYSIRVPSQTVHNLDLADQRRNHLTGAGITLLSGILLFGFGSMQSKTEGAKVVVTPERKCPFCDELIKSEVKFVVSVVKTFQTYNLKRYRSDSIKYVSWRVTPLFAQNVQAG